MPTDCYISKVVVNAKCCSSKLAAEYVSSANYGFNEDEDLLTMLEALDSYISCLEKYRVVDDGDFIEGGMMFLGGKTIVLSKNNSLYLQSEERRIAVSSQDVNCLSEEDICLIISKIQSICAECY